MEHAQVFVHLCFSGTRARLIQNLILHHAYEYANFKCHFCVIDAGIVNIKMLTKTNRILFNSQTEPTSVWLLRMGEEMGNGL